MIGKLRHKIDFYSTTVSNGFGFKNDSSVTEKLEFSTFAFISELSRSDSLNNGLDVEVNQYKVIIRSADGKRNLNKDYRVNWNSTRYNIRTTPKSITIDNKFFFEFIMTREL